MSHLLLSFTSGIVRPMLATQKRPSRAFGHFSNEAIERCRNMGQGASVVDKETLQIIGEVRQTEQGWSYLPKETSA